MFLKEPSWSALSSYQCIFFDFDGVIVESGDIKTEAFMELYANLGIQEEVKKHHLENQGVSRFDKFKWIAENLLNESYTSEKGDKLSERFSALVKSKVIASPSVKGINDLILKLKDSGAYLVVASGTPEIELNEIMMSRGIDHLFNEIHGSPKQKSGIIENTIKKGKFSIEDCLFIGDASTDYDAAKAHDLDFYARLTSELSGYWSTVQYQFGSLDFSKISY
jgi:phosphoglycolate phosphatase-like HAD superfamily hydrolase